MWYERLLERVGQRMRRCPIASAERKQRVIIRVDLFCRRCSLLANTAKRTKYNAWLFIFFSAVLDLTEMYVYRQLKHTANIPEEGGGGGGAGAGEGDSHIKRGGMLVVSLRGVNLEFWSHLVCSGQNAIIGSRDGLL